MKGFLKVYLWGEEIGRLAWHDSRQLAYFNFNPEFLRGNIDIAPLVASIHSPQSKLAIFGETERIYQKLPSFIADSLPDSWGNQLFEQWRRQQRITDRSVTPLEKLAFIGRRGMGALEFVPEIDRGSTPDKISIKALSDLAQKIAEQRENISIQPDENLTLRSLIAVGTSAGGRQPKGIIAMNPKTNEIRSGQIENAPDFEYYLLKFGNNQQSLAEIEQTYYEMALAAGIRMTESRLLEVEGTRHFLTKRFDRNSSGKLHTQTLAAMKPGADSYENLLTVCRRLHLSESDCQEAFRRMVFNIIANNTDDHNKNFAFLMDRNGTWSLSPAYDMTFIFDTGGYLPNKEHCLMIGGKLQDISKEDALTFAAQQGIRKPESIIEKVANAVKQFRQIAEKNGVKNEWIGRIEACINGHLSSWGYDTTNQSFSFSEGNVTVSNARIEPTYKGNYHLLATVNGKEYKYIFRPGQPEHQAITSKGLSNITDADIRRYIEAYILPKCTP